MTRVDLLHYSSLTVDLNSPIYPISFFKRCESTLCHQILWFEGLKVGCTPGLSDGPRVGWSGEINQGFKVVNFFVVVVVVGKVGFGVVRIDAGDGHAGGVGTGNADDDVRYTDIIGCKISNVEKMK